MDAVTVVRGLVARLASLPGGDPAALAALHLDAVMAIDGLIARRALPARFAVRGPARPATLSAALVGAWEHVTAPSALRAYR
jgi:hypothetical protein